MKLTFQLHSSCGSLLVHREREDSPCNAGGWGSGWGPEHQLMYWIKKRLNTCGFNLIKKRMQSDGHLMGEEATPYLRSADKVQRHPHIYIYDPDWMVRNSAEDFNAGMEVRFTITGNIWDKQSHWDSIVRRLCRENGLSIVTEN